MSLAVAYALGSLLSAAVVDVVFRRYSIEERSRGMYVLLAGVTWALLQCVAIGLREANLAGATVIDSFRLSARSRALHGAGKGCVDLRPGRRPDAFAIDAGHESAPASMRNLDEALPDATGKVCSGMGRRQVALQLDLGQGCRGTVTVTLASLHRRDPARAAVCARPVCAWRNDGQVRKGKSG